MERAVILGTAGHIDHGKTALVRALTGVDTDRLAEERRRGITIDLGFAPLRLASGITLGVVDVPGHEAFIRNMLAGATGIDLALLVVAADEGVMPQTREHLAIVTLLGIRAGVVALTKCDLVDDEWLALVRDDLRAALADSPLRDAPVVATSVVTGMGLDALRDRLAEMAGALPDRRADDLFRLPIDRAFSVRGTGTVVTGTVWSGAVARDATVRLLPGERLVRVRGIEVHGEPVTEAQSGMRAAIALAGVEVGEVHRGTVVVSDPAWQPSGLLLAEVSLLVPAARAVSPRTRLRFHLGTSETGARIVTARSDAPAAHPGSATASRVGAPARVFLDVPVVARGGDRFVLRGGSPATTLGGGIVRDPLPPHRRARAWSGAGAEAAGAETTPGARLAQMLAAAGVRGVDVRPLAVRLGVPPAAAADIAARAVARRVGDVLYDVSVVDGLAAALRTMIDDHHRDAPLEPGVPLQLVRARLGAPALLAEAVLDDAVGAGVLTVAGASVMRRGWEPTLPPGQRRTSSELLSVIEAADREPMSAPELARRFGPDTVALLRLLERDGHVVAVEADRYYAARAVERMLGALRAGMAAGRAYNPSELRNLLGCSRKYLIPFLEFCDRRGYTQRRAEGRVRCEPAAGQ